MGKRNSTVCSQCRKSTSSSRSCSNIGSINSTTIGANSAAAGTFTDLTATGTSTITTADINGGNIDGTAIGSSSASTGAFTTLSASSTLDVSGATGIDGDFDINTNKFTVKSSTGNTTVAGTLDVTGDTSVSTFDSSGTTQLATGGGATTIGGTLDISGDVDIDDTTQSTSTTTGALKVDGGVGIAKNLNVGGTLRVTGVTTLTGLLDANGGASISNVQIGVTGNNEIDTSSGNLTIDSAGGTTTIDDDAVVTGTLTIADGSVTINSTGLSVGGTSVIQQKEDGAIHIGENSLITKEVNERQQLYSQDANGKAIPIDITNGTKLLINGRDVEQSINNVGALSAALTGLPTVPLDSKMACGVGTGTHGGNVAVSGGCASKLNERLTMNVAGSLIPTGQDYLGHTNNAWSGRAGFVFKLGKIQKPTLISMKDKKDMQSKIIELSASNTEIKAENQEMKASNQKLRNLLAMQNERLERLEQIALASPKDKKTASSFFNLSKLFLSMKGILVSRNQ